MFTQTFDIPASSRAFVSTNGVPTHYLRAGRTRIGAFKKALSLETFTLDALVVRLSPEARALVPAGDLVTVDVAVDQRAVVTRRGVPERMLAPGRWELWAQPEVAVELIDVSGVDVAPLRGEALRQLAAANGYVEAVVSDNAVGLRYVDGRLDAVLSPGRHAGWKAVHDVSFVTVDLREQVINVNGQEVMTKDKVSLRVNASVTYRVVDARRYAAAAADVAGLVYLAVQLALRNAVATHTLDELLADREHLASELRAPLSSRAEATGLALGEIGVKDLVLPGEMRTLMNRVIEAHKESEANVILRREETAAARSLAQTAKVMADNPLVMRLKELEAYKELAAKVGTLNIVMGERALSRFELKT